MGLLVIRCKIDVSNLIFDLKHTPIFEWCIVGCGSKNIHQKTCIVKRLDYVLTNLNIAMSIIGGTYMTIN